LTLGSPHERYHPILAKGLLCPGDDSGFCCPFGPVPHRAGLALDDEVIAVGQLVRRTGAREEFEYKGGYRYSARNDVLLVGSSGGAPTICIPPKGK
jgi:hypothetical protein